MPSPAKLLVRPDWSPLQLTWSEAWEDVLSKFMMSIVERVDGGIASLKASGHVAMDVVMNDSVYAAFLVQGEADTLDLHPTTIRGLPIVRVRDGLRSAVRASAEDQAGRVSYVID